MWDYMAKRFDDAAAAFQRVRRLNPRFSLLMMWSAATFAQLGKMEDACAARDAFLELRCGFSIRDHMKRTGWKGAFKGFGKVKYGGSDHM